MAVKSNAPPTLRELQRWMCAVIRAPQPADRKRSPRADCSAYVLPAAPQAAAVRLQVYIGGYPARIRESLEESFPAVAKVLGPRHWTRLVERYTRWAPQPSYNLNHAGALLPKLLRTDPLALEFPFLPDLARLEWQVVKAFHARAMRPLSASAVAQWSSEQWERAVIRFQPAVSVVESDWPVRKIWWSALQGKLRGRMPRSRQRNYALVWRAGFRVRCDAISAGEAQALGLLLRRCTLGELSRHLQGRVAPSEVTRWFSSWMAAGMIVGCTANGLGEQAAALEKGTCKR